MADETYRTIIEKIARTKSSTITVFADFCRVAACCLAAGSREEEYFKAIKTYSKDELTELSKALALLISEMESKPFTDVLGTYYLDIASHSSKQSRGEFYTPPEISKLMAMITVDAKSVIEKGKPITVNEPACGAGGMMLALAEQFAPHTTGKEKSYVDLLRVTCQDLNPVGVDMCYINMTLWGIPATMICGDTLRGTINNSWKNIHWHRVGEDQRQAVVQMMDFIKNPQTPEKEKTADITMPNTSFQTGEQFELEF